MMAAMPNKHQATSTFTVTIREVFFRIGRTLSGSRRRDPRRDGVKRTIEGLDRPSWQHRPTSG